MPSREEMAARITARKADALPRCSVPGCSRPTMLAAGRGLADTLCRYHVDQKARHGSTWRGSYPATELRPYLLTAQQFIKGNQADPHIALATAALQGMLDGSGRVEAAMSIKRRPAKNRAKIALARLRAAGITGERILANHMAMAALIADDAGRHRVEEHRVVQVAKALHRLASGTHRRWDYPLSDGRTAPVELHVYPRSSGRVLREIGREVDELCADATAHHVETIRALKTERNGPHPSRQPGWRPLWRQRMDAAHGR